MSRVPCRVPVPVRGRQGEGETTVDHPREPPPRATEITQPSHAMPCTNAGTRRAVKPPRADIGGPSHACRERSCIVSSGDGVVGSVSQTDNDHATCDRRHASCAVLFCTVL